MIESNLIESIHSFILFISANFLFLCLFVFPQFPVWPNTEKTIFTDEFLLQATKCSNYKQGITSPSILNTSSYKHGIVLAALDCVPTRRYLDSRCVTLHLPLIESGTLGTKGHVQVILPDITESYNSQMDDDVHNNNDVDGNGNIDSQVNTIPYCTLKSFPTLPIHCIEWAREKVSLIIKFIYVVMFIIVNKMSTFPYIVNRRFHSFHTLFVVHAIHVFSGFVGVCASDNRAIP